MNRRSLFKRIGAAAAVVAAAPIAEVVNAAPEVDERAQAQMIYDRWLSSEDGWQEMVQRAQELRSADCVRLTTDNLTEDAYQRGLTAGLNGAIDRYYSVMDLATVTVASAEGKYVARMAEDQ